MSHSPIPTSRLLPMMVAGQIGSYTGYVALPFVTGVLIDTVGFDARSAGVLGSLETGVMAVTALFMSTRIHRLSLRRVAVTGAVLAIAAHGMAAVAVSFPAFAALRILAGIGEGLLASVGGPLLARALTPERMSALVAMTAAVIYAVLLGLIPVALLHGGQAGTFATLALFLLLTVPFLTRIPSTPSIETNDQAQREPFPVDASVVGLLLGAFLLGISEAGVWNLDQRFASRVGLNEQALGVVLGAAGILSLAGAGLVAWMGTRFGRLIPLTSSVAMVGVSHYVTITATVAPVLIASLCVEAFTLFVVLPLMYGTAVGLDRTGRVATAVGGSMLLGRGLGPGLFGALLESTTYELLGVTAFMLSALAAVCFTLSIRSSRELQSE